MTTIISGRFAQQDQAELAIVALQRAGAPRAQITSFYVNPPGQHDLYPIGGDRDESPGAEDSDKGAAAGLGVGGVLGGTAGSIAGPLGVVTGALVGAHVGSLVGSLSRTDDSTDIPPLRKSGMLVAVAVSGANEEERAITTLRTANASCMERSEGQIVNGDWIDFDPLSIPQFV